MTLRQRETSAKSKPTDTPKEGQKPKEGPKPFRSRYNPKFQKRPERTGDGTWMDHQVWTKIVMGAALGIVLYFTITRPTSYETPLAKRSEFLNGKRSQNSLCAPSYKAEISKIGAEKCIPARCGRAVNDGLISNKDAHELLKLAKKGLAKEGSSGGASIIDLHSGALSSGQQFVNLYKKYPDLYQPQDFNAYNKVKNQIRDYISEHFDVSGLYLTHPTFFSRLDSNPAQTMHDEYWHLHVDKETYANFHYTSLLYLTDFGEDFSGGEFVFVDSHDKLNRTIEPRLGRLSFFTSGIENKHYVKPVKNGARYALTLGFTCDPSKKIEDLGSEEHFNAVKK